MNEDQSSNIEPRTERLFFRASAEEFKKIPGSPIAYSASEGVSNLFAHGVLADFADTRLGMATADNNRFLRFWYEVGYSEICFNANSREQAVRSQKRWYPYQKGGEYRKWFGNAEYCVDWANDGKAIQNFADLDTGKIRSHNYNLDFIFRRGVTWNALTSGKTSARISENSLFDNAGSSLFVKKGVSVEAVMGLVNSNVMLEVFPLISPTLNYQPGDLSKLPAFFPDHLQAELATVVSRAIEVEREDWNSYETAWNFAGLPLLHAKHLEATLEASYQSLRARWREITLELQRLEQENNRLFIDAYGLQEEVTPEVPPDEITLTCNPPYRYGGDKSEEDLEAMLLADTMRELVSYAVGCMLGRYSLDKSGLILANQGETLADYLEQHRLAQVPQPRFPADDDNVIPVLDGDWFADEITLRFRQFLRVAFGDEHYEDNLAFIAQALNLKGKRNYSLRDYFLSEFYADHVKRYKKRPIYWLFSSPKGSFNALIYMHRYRPDTVSVVLRYLRDFRKKVADEKDRQVSASINPAVSQGDRTRALKETDRLNKVLAELDDYERDVLYPKATEQIEIDLDEGVKVNYLRFGSALKKIVGLEAKDED
jgi:type II restriction/modification system DNA methylase subunit YeeA